VLAGGACAAHVLVVDLIAIYIEDHLALSLAGVRLARRCRRENPANELGRFLDGLIPDLEQDRAMLREVAGALRTGGSAAKQLAAAGGEWLGRFKPNGRLFGYSELSRLWELEALEAGSLSRECLWRALDRAGRKDPRLSTFEFAPLEERARQQREALEGFRLRAVEVALAPAPRAAVGARPAEHPAS
jgi:hypothetical protein